MQQKADKLFREQMTGWPLLAENRERLDSALLKSFEWDGVTIRVQYNPKRITSSSARVDRVSIEARPCFLCREHRPPEQDFAAIGKGYEILCNPFPIFRKHFTIAKADHTPQVIDPEFSSMLDLARDLPDLVIFYNGPACGASAPDHMHFQAGNRGFLPLEDELENLLARFGNCLSSNGKCRVTAIDDGLRRFLVLESDRKQPLEDAFSAISSYMRQLASGDEPMLNLLTYFRAGWQIIVFPREKHRPWQYFDQGEQNILLSPASVDLGGVMITPLEKDFNKITGDDIADIFNQIGLTEKCFDKLNTFLKQKLS